MEQTALAVEVDVVTDDVDAVALWSGPLGKFFEFFGIIASICRKTSGIQCGSVQVT